MIYSVIVDVSNSQVDRVFDYTSDQQYLLGQRVLVDFANRKVEGYIVDIKDSSQYPVDKLKPIIRAKDQFAVIKPELLQLGKQMMSIYNLRFIDVLRLFVPSQLRGDRVSSLTKRMATIDTSVQLSDYLNSLNPRATMQRDLVTFLYNNGATATALLSNKFSSSAVAKLSSLGVISVYEEKVNRTPPMILDGAMALHTLTANQQSVVDRVLSRVDKYLLHGVTGSGKTEVYMSIIESMQQQGKSAILLVPEISLTPNMLRLFRMRFGDCVAILHSGLSVGERYDEWMRLHNGQATIAIGARSAIFAPLDNIGIIIIDEEHDSSYISEFNPRYNSIEVATMRANYNGCSILLGSATPSLDSYYKASTGQYQLLTMPDRINNMPLPTVEIVDMAQQSRIGKRGIISDHLKQRLDETIASGNQAILFINRRGYSSFLMCNDCGYVAKCSDCDISLTVHKEDNLLKCHYCNKRYKMLTICPSCHSSNFRSGRIGTEQVQLMLQKMYPDIKVLRMDADTTSNRDGHAKIISSFAKGEAQILLGTQMIAKGHDFGRVTLVGILDGDQSLHFSNYLSCERTFQLLTQVAGRSGRDKTAGIVVLQTHTPQHYCLQYASKQDYIGFFKREINLRENANFPPFATIVRILYTSEDSKKAIDLVTNHYIELCKLSENNTDKFFFLDKMRCPLSRAEKKYRFQILIRLTNDSEDIIENIYNIINTITDKHTTVFAERNPNNLS